MFMIYFWALRQMLFTFYWLCGLNPQKKESKKSPVTPAAPDLSQLKENPRLKQVLNANLIICLSVAIFIIGYWAWEAASLFSEDVSPSLQGCVHFILCLSNQQNSQMRNSILPYEGFFYFTVNCVH